MDKVIAFVKKHLLSIFVSLAAITFILGLFFSVVLEISRIFLALVAIAAFFERKDSWTIKKQLLKTKGLTEDDIRNIRFVKKWEETRKKGIWNYCITDGGIILGAGLSLIIAVAFFCISGRNIVDVMDGPGSIFSFIGYTYLAGSICGVITFRILWPYQERRFIRLTDPLSPNI